MVSGQSLQVFLGWHGGSHLRAQEANGSPSWGHQPMNLLISILGFSRETEPVGSMRIYIYTHPSRGPVIFRLQARDPREAHSVIPSGSGGLRTREAEGMDSSLDLKA